MHIPSTYRDTISHGFSEAATGRKEPSGGGQWTADAFGIQPQRLAVRCYGLNSGISLGTRRQPNRSCRDVTIGGPFRLRSFSPRCSLCPVRACWPMPRSELGGNRQVHKLGAARRTAPPRRILVERANRVSERGGGSTGPRPGPAARGVGLQARQQPPAYLGGAFARPGRAAEAKLHGDHKKQLSIALRYACPDRCRCGTHRTGRYPEELRDAQRPRARHAG